MEWWIIALLILAAIILFVVGMIVGFKMRAPRHVGTLLVIKDPIDDEKYLTLEILKGQADEIYDGNEITLKVIERVGKAPQNKQAL